MAAALPKKEFEESAEDQIKKHTILELILDTKVWGEPYVENQFCYVEKDLSKLSPATL